MKKAIILFLSMTMLLVLSACGKEPVNELKYKEFKKEVTSKDFEGFAYILTDYEAEDNDYMVQIKKAFEEEKSSLVYYNAQTSDKKTYNKFNRDSADVKMYLPINEIVYLKDDRKSVFEIDEKILTHEGYEALKKFIADHKK